MKLIIVESPTKARTLTRFLDKEYRIEATMGHIRDLPKSDLGVDVGNNFTPKYIIPADKRSRVKELAALAIKAESVILATDPDREGEAIGWHIAKLLSDKTKSRKPAEDYERIIFHEITKEAIIDALKHPRVLDIKLIDAQQARRILDRLVGYKLSPLLWAKLSRRWLSAGRVQSVAVRLIVEREREIRKFREESYFTITGKFVKPLKDAGDPEPGQLIEAELVSRDGVKYEEKITMELFDGQYTVAKTSIGSEGQARSIISSFSEPFTVQSVDKKEIRRTPPPPLTTSYLQQEASRRAYFSSKKTMQVAQKLYEEGLITYHRTDSVNLAEKFVKETREYIGHEFGNNYLPEKVRVYKTKSKVAQEAHEAIRPTDITVSSHDLGKYEWVNRDHIRLYEIIWKRSLASQMAEAVFDSTGVAVTSANNFRFEAQGSVVKFDGYLKVLGRENGDKIIPPLSVGETLVLKETGPVGHQTAPPPRYTEATLVKTLEEKDIGRPSTYAPIISTIVDRNYIVKDQKKLMPTDLGFAVTDFLVLYFPEIINLPFTANLEADLDKIANGESPCVPVIAGFYEVFNRKIEETYKIAPKVKMEVTETGEACPDCGSGLVFRMGRYGKFVACSNFPACKYTRQHAETIDLACPKCGKPMVAKKSRHGKMFYGCSGYPTCTFAAWKKEDIKTEDNRQRTENK